MKKAERAGDEDLSSAVLYGLPISDIVKRKRIRSKAGWGEARQQVREGLEARRRRVIILSVEQPVVGLEPDRSDPRMRLKQNWSFHAEGVWSSEARDQWSERKRVRSLITVNRSLNPRFGDESNQVS